MGRVGSKIWSMSREEASGQFRHHPLLHTPTTPSRSCVAAIRCNSSDHPSCRCQDPPNHLDHLWLLPDLSSVTPPIIPSTVVRISARGYFAMRSTVDEDLQILSLLGLSLFGPLIFGSTLFGRTRSIHRFPA